VRLGCTTGYWVLILLSGGAIPFLRSYFRSFARDQYTEFQITVVHSTSRTYDGAIVDASTIRFGLSWGYSLAVACYRLRTEVSGSLGQVNIEWDDISVSNVLQHTVVKSPIE